MVAGHAAVCCPVSTRCCIHGALDVGYGLTPKGPPTSTDSHAILLICSWIPGPRSP
jgi:hypothetical protein